MEWGPVSDSTVVSYLLAYGAPDDLDNDNLATALESQIQISLVLMGKVRKTYIDSIVFVKQWGIATEKAQKLSKPQCREGFGQCSTLHCQDDSELMIIIFIIIDWYIVYCQT